MCDCHLAAKFTVVGSLIAAVYFMLGILIVHKTLKAVLGVLYILRSRGWHRLQSVIVTNKVRY